MKTMRTFLLMLLAWPIGLLAEVSRDSVPSNYGGWVNLTEGYSEIKGDNHAKMEVAVVDNTIHLCWAELEKTSDDVFRVLYRRSPDLGKTWKDTKVVFEINSGRHVKYT